MSGLTRVLIANRGEIALRILRACVDEGYETVLAGSPIDRDSLPAKLADRYVTVGGDSAAESYLSVERLVAAAIATGCDALHPGYGFLAEHPALAEACAEHDIAFVGPSADTIRRGGDKLQCRQLAERAGVRTGGASAAVSDPETAIEHADALGYPVLLKAAAGGGGRGMRRAESADELRQLFETTVAEAQQAFGDGRVFVEKFFEEARHIEVQVLGDTRGTRIHLGERDCSYQRRYQKLVEEAPATAVPEHLLEELRHSAVRLAHELGYIGAGTVEFIVSPKRGDFAFLEMNTRIQVEHPVTEMITGVDLVRAQLRIAAGEPLGISQDDIRMDGHAIECRINAEDPANDFRPAAGPLRQWVAPIGTHVRTDTHCYPGYVVPPRYDSLLGKIIVGGLDRGDAIARMRRALSQLKVSGVPTTGPFLRDLISHPDFAGSSTSTTWVEDEFLPSWLRCGAGDHDRTTTDP